MKTKRFLPLIGLVTGLVILLSACVQAGAGSTPEPATPIAKATSRPYALATPYAQEPAAGICATFDGEVVTISLNADVPDPRCAKVRPDQTLKVINNTVSPLSVSIGAFKSALLAANEYSIDVRFGDYLAPGVHQLQVSPCCGAEIWLEGK
jgi:hypothetical protein